MVMRDPQWQRLLNQHLAERKEMPFSWGANDCMASVCAWFEKVSGENVFSEFAGYSTEDEAKAVLEKHGGVIGILDRFLGQSHGNPLRAGRGDIVVVRVPEDTAGIVDDTGQFIAVVTPEGLRRLPLAMASLIWKV